MYFDLVNIAFCFYSYILILVAEYGGYRIRTFIWLLKRALIPFLRGVLQSLFFGSLATPPLIEKNVKILYRNKIKLGKFVYIGLGTFINALTLDGILIGNRVTLREYGHIQGSSSPKNPGVGLTISDHVYIGPRCLIGIGEKIFIGKNTLIGANFTAVSENHKIENNVTSMHETIRKGIRIGNNCWIGHGVTILDGVHIGDKSIIGAGSVVTKSFPSNSKIVGNPARLI